MHAGSSKRAAFCIALAIAGSARADDAQPKPSEVGFELAAGDVIVRVGDTDTIVKVGCEPRSFAWAGTRAYALCGTRTVVFVDALPTPHVALRLPIARMLTSLTFVDGVISARTASGIVPLASLPVGQVSSGVSPAPRERPRFARPEPPEAPPVQGLELSLVGTGGFGFDGPFGASAVFDAAAIYRPPFPLLLAAYGTFGAATGLFDLGDRTTGPHGGDVQVAEGEGLVGVDTRWVAFAFGAGAGLFERGSAVEPLIVARGRFGLLDGFAFSWHTSFATSGNTILGVLGASLEFRVLRRLWLGAEAELGNLRYGRFLGDLRWRLRGDGPNGTVDLRFGAGLAYVESSADCQQLGSGTTTGTGDVECIGTNADYLGPAASFGIVWRP